MRRAVGLRAAAVTGVAVVVGLAFAPLPGGTAEAATITNRDSTAHRFSIVPGAASDARTLKPGESVRDICAKGCILRLGGDRDSDYEIEGQDNVSIENGQLYYDGPSEQKAPSAVSPVPSLRPGR